MMAEKEDPKLCYGDSLEPRVGKRFFYSFTSNEFEYIFDAKPTGDGLKALKSNGVDLCTFTHRSFLEIEPNYNYHREYENIAVMTIESFDKWWTTTLKKKERQSVKKAQKMGVTVRKVVVDNDFLKGIQKIYNETEFREGRRYSGYGLSLEELRVKFKEIGDSEILGAYLENQLIGILWLAFGDSAAMFRSFVSLINQRDKCPNNALIAEAVKRCEERKIRFLVYGNHYGFLPSLDQFREHQGFEKCPIPRYFVPLSSKGQLAIKLRLHRKLEYSIPIVVERALLKLYNPVSRAIPASIWYRFGGE
jgi:hypothetical protein